MSDDVTLPDATPALDDTPDATDPEAQKRAIRRRKKAEDERAEFWKRCLADPVGRMVLWEFFTDCGALGTTFAATPAGFPDPTATWFYLGRKDVGQRLYQTLMRHDRMAIALMHEEHDPLWAKPKRVKDTDDPR